MANLQQSALNALGSIEITDKEYLLFNEATRELLAINGDNYSQVMGGILRVVRRRMRGRRGVWASR